VLTSKRIATREHPLAASHSSSGRETGGRRSDRRRMPQVAMFGESSSVHS
jgi:hypothetical protein